MIASDASAMDAPAFLGGAMSDAAAAFADALAGCVEGVEAPAGPPSGVRRLAKTVSPKVDRL